MKTYFNFEQKIASKDLVEAISLPHGIGPFCGFGGHTISSDNSHINISAEPSDGNSIAADKDFYDRFHIMIHDRIKARNIYKETDGVTNFGCISKDGYIYTSPDTSISIPIEGSHGVNDDIIVMAVHVPISEAVENPIEFRAFWSQSSSSFYDLYKKSIDPGYPTKLSDRDLTPENVDPLKNEVLNYNTLNNLVIAALPSGIYDENSMNIIGVYGQGNNSLNDGSLENYRIIPYDGKFPMEIPFNSAFHGILKNTLSKLLSLCDGVPDDYTNIIDYLKTLIPEQTTQTVNNSLPKGTIVMWYGSQKNIPNGWELCDGSASVNDSSIIKPNLMGRVPVGLSNKEGDYSKTSTLGGNDSINLKIDQIPRHKHMYHGNISVNNGALNDLQANFPTKVRDQGFGKGSFNHNSRQGVYYSSLTGGIENGIEGSDNPIDIRQSYCVVAFIIKTID